MALESLTGLDLLIQNIFFHHGEWLISRPMHTACKAWLYTGPKVAIVLVAVAGLFVFAAPFIFPKMRDRLVPWQKPALLALLSICLIPLLAATGKAGGGVWGTLDTLPYGGEHPHRGLLMQLLLYGQTAGGKAFRPGTPAADLRSCPFIICLWRSVGARSCSCSGLRPAGAWVCIKWPGANTFYHTP